MHRALYSEILDDSPADARAREREAIERSIELLNSAKKKGVGSRESIEALHYLDRLWSLLLDDLANADNADEQGFPFLCFEPLHHFA